MQVFNSSDTDERYGITNGDHEDITLFDVVDTENDFAVVIDGVPEYDAVRYCERMNDITRENGNLDEPVIVFVRGGVAYSDAQNVLIVDFDNEEEELKSSFENAR